MQRAPESIKMKDPTSGDSPLMSAVERNVPFETLQLILDADPQALRVPNNYGELPVHGAADFGNHHEVLRLWIDGYPEGLSMKDSIGRLPFYRSMANRFIGIECLNLLYEGYPMGLTAAANSDKCPESARTLRDETGNLPVHIAAARDYRRVWDILKLLVNAYPGSLQEENNEGNLPLHSAVARSDASPEIVQFMLEESPQASYRRNQSGKQPLHLACEWDVKLDVIYLLVIHSVELLSGMDG